ncbi:MAG TPA: NADH-quinone oxidoreductase subunit C [Candidatus Xenobia bacterium]|jgi:Ni,Fe-hydrogenase III large subunit/Ni,Fe-hydrogenase III component G
MTLPELHQQVRATCDAGGHLALLTACAQDASDLALVAVLIPPGGQQVELLFAPVGPGASYPALSADVPQAHWFERALGDMFGLHPEGHPRFKSLILHEAWPDHFHPLRDAHWPEDIVARHYPFLSVEGQGVFEIPVGPIHASVIEPGHFRFSCLGEIIENLEIRLGYQHRGLEQQLTQVPWQKARFWAEAASSDTSVGNALAHAWAVEDLLQATPPREAVLRRALALEIERIASHLGDLGGLAADIGYAGGAAIFGRLRGQALGLGEWLTGSRFLTGYVIPGGVAFDSPPPTRDHVSRDLEALQTATRSAVDLFLENPSVLERMEGIGRLRPRLARQFGLVGPAGRASGVACDIRQQLRQEPWSSLTWTPASGGTGDVLSRAQVRVSELHTSLDLVGQMLQQWSSGPLSAPLPADLPVRACGLGIVEAWRGELLHLIMTDAAGRIVRYAIKDPSFHNWTGLAIAARGELVADFPLCNKSFSLSYSGNDL